MTIAVNFELNGALEEHVRALIIDGGEFENVAAYLADLIRRDCEDEQPDPETLAVLREAFSEPAYAISPFDPEAFRAELKSRRV